MNYKELIGTPPYPKKEGQKVYWQNLYGCTRALAIIENALQSNGPTLIITPDPHFAHQLERELVTFCQPYPLKIHLFPDWETLPYDSFSPHQDIISERLRALCSLNKNTQDLYILSASTFSHRLPPAQHLKQSSLSIKVGDQFSIEEMAERLTQVCYQKVSQVTEHGEFATRGSLMDIFPMGAQDPIRVELFDTEVDTLRTFDPDSQLSLEKTEQIELLPGREFPLTADSVKRFRSQWRKMFEGNPKQCRIYEAISQQIAPAGIEYFLPLFYESLSTFIDYLPKTTTVVFTHPLQETLQIFWSNVQERYEQYRHDKLNPILPPSELFLNTDEFFTLIKPFRQIHFTNNYKDKAHYHCFDFKPFPDLSLNHKLENPLQKLSHFIEKEQCRVLILAESKGRRESLKKILAKQQLLPTDHDSIENFMCASSPLGLSVAPLDQGLWAPPLKIALIAESQLYGKQVMQRRRRRKNKVIEQDFSIRSIAELSIHDPIVHFDFGVGRYLGLKPMSVGDHNGEFLEIQYAGTDKLYVPVNALNLISKYSGVDPEQAPLNKLGTDQWDKAKQKAIKKAQDVAAELLAVYAKREAQTGILFNSQETDIKKFASQFPFEETPDQAKAILEVQADMQSEKPMDRLVCGDVGFGKTEVAMRAAFLAVQNGFQVAVLVPTTLLAQQHYETFMDRFSEWPFQLEVLSRFKAPKEQALIISQIQSGAVDIILGTHKIIQPNIKFHNLGLVVIDEEHRFGVKQKEQLKKLRAKVDILTLTATPIPRTLNMAFASLRDLSIIATPPQKRLSIKTFVREWSPPLIKEAVMRELMRGGQIYYLHNTVETIERTASDLAQLIPQAKIGVAHGQMRERELEGIMADFYHQRFNLLVCTTIIETGIDVPSANTILIERADKLGLAQLHQLRGRVGRSHHQAYAFCLTAPKKQLKQDALKRLEALESLEELGSGFTLASQDLEIRGAGELLGEGQSGNVQSIGFSLYINLLEKAVQSLKAGEPALLDDFSKPETEIDLSFSALIPDSYVKDVHSRLLLYKRLAHASTAEQLSKLRAEIIDRFGLLPTPTQNLFKIMSLKLLASPLGILKIEANSKGGRILFSNEPHINSTAIIEMIRTKPLQYKIQGSEVFRFKLDMPTSEDRFKMVESLINQLTPEESLIH